MDEKDEALKPGRGPIERLEAGLIACLFWGLAGLHGLYAFILRADSDEPQHLHVVWGWTQGQLPYRDFFDNHAPLFSWLCSPLLRLLGERADILPWMRLAILPLVAACLAGVYLLGARHFGRRPAMWAAAATGFFPPFFYASSEFRPDILWTALWLFSLIILLTGEPRPRRLFWFGLIFGLAAAASLKTVFLAATLLMAAALVFAADRRRLWTAGAIFKAAAAMGAGFLLVSAAWLMFFAAHGAWRPLSYCLVFHNALPGMSESQGWLRFRPVLIFLALPALFRSARVLRRTHSSQCTFLWLTAAAYPVVLVSFSPLLTRQDYLPGIPLLALAAAGAFFAWTPPGSWKPALLAALVLGEALAVVAFRDPGRDRTELERDLLAATLRLTTPRDFVMDLKGETIFRYRPFYYALEDVTRARLQRGLIADDIAQRLIATQTAVVHTRFAIPFPRAAQAFVTANYLSVGPLSVLGKVIKPEKQKDVHQVHRYRFQIDVPADYVVMAGDGLLADAQLDGAPLGSGAQSLAAGAHEIDAGTTGGLIVFWARAWDQGWRPLAAAGLAAPAVTSPSP